VIIDSVFSDGNLPSSGAPLRDPVHPVPTSLGSTVHGPSGELSTSAKQPLGYLPFVTPLRFSFGMILFFPGHWELHPIKGLPLLLRRVECDLSSFPDRRNNSYLASDFFFLDPLTWSPTSSGLLFFGHLSSGAAMTYEPPPSPCVVAVPFCFFSPFLDNLSFDRVVSKLFRFFSRLQ